MPNRILRPGILTSERIDALTPGAEIFYRRLMSIVDDFGRFEADWRVLRSALFPLRAEQITQAEIEVWLAECSKPISQEHEPLVTPYTVDRKRYLQISDFRQRVRAKAESRFPGPPSGKGGEPNTKWRSHDGHMTAYTENCTLPTTAPTSSSSPPTTSTSTPAPTPTARGLQPTNGVRSPDDEPDSRQAFDALAEAYPPAGRERLEKARDVFREVLTEEAHSRGIPQAEILVEMGDGLARWTVSTRWHNGRVHLLANWLKERLWREHPVALSEAKLARIDPERVSRREQGTADFRRILAREMAERRG